MPSAFADLLAGSELETRNPGKPISKSVAAHHAGIVNWFLTANSKANLRTKASRSSNSLRFFCQTFFCQKYKTGRKIGKAAEVTAMESEFMYERFTDRARKVMQLANQEAQRFNHEYIGTEHVLLGLIKEGGGVAANVLRHLDIDLRRIRLEAQRIVQSGPDTVTMGNLPRTPRAKKVLEYTMEEARNLNHNYVGTEHILLGLLREEEGVAAQVLMNLGLKLEDVRGEVLSLLGHDIKTRERGNIQPGEQRVSKSNLPPGTEIGHSLYSRFTETAKKAMQFAYREAGRLRHEYIGTEHFLLALIALGHGTSINLLKRHKIDLPSLRSYLERLGAADAEGKPEDDLPHTPRAKRVIEFAIEEARARLEDSTIVVASLPPICENLRNLRIILIRRFRRLTQILGAAFSRLFDHGSLMGHLPGGKYTKIFSENFARVCAP